MDSTTNAADTAAAMGVFAGVMMVYGIVILAIIALMIWFYWRIFTKAGYSGAMSLLNLIPGVGHLICLIILAFGRWPIEDALAASGARVAGTGVPPPPYSPPGSTIAPT